ncbi:MAG: glutaredoxin family protein [Candidatus Methanoperedens sp.]|nr:glutaredoxin family protein [Candidatus Methanoperedens sp.]MCE8425023.1 glutaredoxin family protein [Candidatus Methanoperedens sp.]MCE8427229.1 glutaredoxin family protein [Candidatus Methanoperedens sp.]
MNKARPMLYTLSTCVHCKATKRFFKSQGIIYDFIDVDKLEGREKEDVRSEMIRLSGTVRFPTIVIGDTVIVGFYEDKIRAALGL